MATLTLHGCNRSALCLSIDNAVQSNPSIPAVVPPASAGGAPAPTEAHSAIVVGLIILNVMP
jgi:hypothetical protein